MVTMNRREAIAYLTQCADDNGTHWSGGRAYPLEECPTCHGTNDAGHLGTPGSPYGRTSADCAPVAWRLAYLIARETGEPITCDGLNHAMSMVVNGHEDVAYMVRNYGGYKYV